MSPVMMMIIIMTKRGYLHCVADVLLTDALLQLFVLHAVLPQLAQHVRRLGLLELKLHLAVLRRDDAVRGVGNDAKLVHGNARSPRRVGAGRQRGGIR